MAHKPEEILEFYNGEVTLIYDSALHAYYVLEDGVRYLVPGSSTVCGIIDKSGPLTQWAANTTVQYIRENLETHKTKRCANTGVLLPFDLESLLNEARFNYRKISQAAKDIGTIAHEWLLEYVVNLLSDSPLSEVLIPSLPTDEKAKRCVEAALKWMQIHNFQPIEAENKIYSRTYGYAGTFDWTALVTSCGVKECCPFSGTLKLLGDYKSSKALYEEYRAQTASYKFAYNEEKDHIAKDTPPWESERVQGRVLLRLGKDDGEFEPKVMLDEEEYERDLEGFLGALQVYNWLQQFKVNEKVEKLHTKAAKKAAKAADKAAKPARRVRRITVPVEELIPIGV